MKLTQVRNATVMLEYAGKRLLIDPMLADKETYPGFPGTANAHLRNPLVALPAPVQDLLQVDAVIVTHTHLDHWDEAAQQQIPKDMLIYTQNESDAELIRGQGFGKVIVLGDITEFAGITLVKTDGQHGSDEAYAIPEMAELLGDACGIVFKHPEEKTLYFAGDTIWVDAVVDSLREHTPDVVVVNAGFAQVDGLGAIIMGKEDTLRIKAVLPEAKVVASHMEAVNHCVLSRQELREFARMKGIEQDVFVPEDGEALVF